MVTVALTLMLLAGTDAPWLVPDEATTVDLEPLHREVRRLDAQLLLTSDRMPLGFALGAVALFAVGVGLVPVAIFFTAVGVRVVGGSWMFASAAAGVLVVGSYVLIPLALLLGAACLVSGFSAIEAARTRRGELTRERDAALRRLELRSSSFRLEPALLTLAAF